MKYSIGDYLDGELIFRVIGLMCLTLAIPLTISVFLIFVGRLDVLSLIWRGYYFEGYLFGIIAWKYHLALFIFIYIGSVEN